jgi:hypothetical protein
MPESADFSNPLRIFYSYSHSDEWYREKLGNAIALLRRQGLIQDWHDRKIVAGYDWKNEIDQHVESADIILLLVSSDFIASDYCFGVEMSRALERKVNGSADVLPIIVRDVDLTNAPFAHLQFLPKDGLAISKWDDIDSAYKDVAIGLRTAVSRAKHRRAAAVQIAMPSASIRELRRFDAAIAAEIPLNRSREVAAQVRLEGSEGLVVLLEQDLAGGEKARSYSCLPSDVRSSETFSLPWLRADLEIGEIDLYLRLDAPGLGNAMPEKRIKAQPFRDSGVFTFQVTAASEGEYSLTVQLVCRDASLAERVLRTRASEYQGPGGGPGAISEWVIASAELRTRAIAMGAVASARH